MSGLLALLDDVAAIAKLAAAQLDDVAAQATKAGAKAAGVVVDDAAVTPKYVAELPAARELPIIWKIARASIFNKLVILLPLALLMNAFLPALITPLLMLGGLYLCFEGAEKIWHLIAPHPEQGPQQAQSLDAAHLEEERVAGAIKTDFVLSAEIMTISLAAIEVDDPWTQGGALAAVAVGITALVYGAVALLVKGDDIGLKMSRTAHFASMRKLGRGIVQLMPKLMTLIGTVGTAAMLWVGGSIVIHGSHTLGWHLPYETANRAVATVSSATGGSPAIEWLATATLDGVAGLVLGLCTIPIGAFLLKPVLRLIKRGKS